MRYGAMGVQSSAVARRDVVRVLWFAPERYSTVTEWAMGRKCCCSREQRRAEVECIATKISRTLSQDLLPCTAHMAT